MDPLCEKYYGVSPYAYCENDPLLFIDSNGMFPIYDTYGRFLGTDDSGLVGFPLIMDKSLFRQGMSSMEAASVCVLGEWPEGIEDKVISHYESLKSRPDYDGFVTIGEGISWAKAHPNALKNPTPDNTLYINASLLDFGALSTSDFKNVGNIEAINLFSNENILKSVGNPELMATVYALGRVNMRLIDRDKGLVEVINDNATDYDWNCGGGWKRNLFININNGIWGIDPAIHGFKTYYYGYGQLNQ